MYQIRLISGEHEPKVLGHSMIEGETWSECLVKESMQIPKSAGDMATKSKV